MSSSATALLSLLDRGQFAMAPVDMPVLLMSRIVASDACVIDSARTEAALREFTNASAPNTLFAIRAHLDSFITVCYMTLSELLYNGRVQRELHTGHPINVYLHRHHQTIFRACTMFVYLTNYLTRRGHLPGAPIVSVDQCASGLLYIVRDFVDRIEPAYVELCTERSKAVPAAILRLGLGSDARHIPSDDDIRESARRAAERHAPVPQDLLKTPLRKPRRAKRK